MTASIHQPNFMPWLGYFHKVAAVDKMIFFDTVALSNGKSWTSRCGILLNGREHWLTLPIERKGLSGQHIYTVKLLNFKQNWEKTLATLRHAYGRAPFFEDVFPYFLSIGSENFDLLADFNVAFIEETTRRLGFDHVQFLRASDEPSLLISSELKTGYILQTCQAFGVQHYLAGKGNSLQFLELEKFVDARISVDFQQFTQSIYPQNTEGEAFVAGLSIVDALMNLGWTGTADLLSKQLQKR